MGKLTVTIAIALALAASAHAAGPPFVITIVNAPESVPLGAARPTVDAHGEVKGWVTLQIPVEVKVVGQAPLPVVPGSFWGYRDGSGLFSIFARVHDENGTEVRPCRPIGYAYDVVLGEMRLDPGWTHRLNVPVCVPGVGRYVIEVVAEETASSYTTIEGKLLELWMGSVASRPVTVDVVTPQGIDKEAYEAFGGDPLDASGRFWDTLRRFPTSTYAAYVVWEQYAQGTAGVDAEKEADSIERGPGNVHGGTQPCDREGRMSSTDNSALSGISAVQCRDDWLGLVLDNHPNIWFAGEMRLRLALDAYLLGDRAGCAAQLRDLAEHGRPYVAAKAGELLAAMQAKGMFEGEAK